MRWMNTLIYSITKVYNDLGRGSNRVRWNNIVWNRIATPKSRFIAWLAFNNRLKTKHCLKLAGVVDSNTCLIYELEKETMNHLFFQCPFSQKCVAKLKVWFVTNSKIEILEDTLRRNQLGPHKRKQFEATLCNLIYAIWSIKNDGTWNQRIPMVNQVVGSIKDASETIFKFLGSLRSDSV